jgi:stage V sporulation protein G
MYKIRTTKLDNPSGKVVGFATLVVEEKFVFNSIKIIKSENSERGFFLAMPSYKKSDGSYVEYFHPTSKEMVNEMCDAVTKSLKTGEEVTFYDIFNAKFITEVEPHNYNNDKAKVTVKISDDFVCDSIRVMSGKNGKLFVGMPSVKDRDDEYRQLCNPITADFRSELYGDILDKYDEKMKIADCGFVEIPQTSYMAKMY